MTDLSSVERRSWRQQSLFVYGIGLAVGLYMALIQVSRVPSLSAFLFILFGAMLLSTAAWLLWRYVLPRTTGLALHVQIAVQMVVSGAVFGVIAFLVTELYLQIFLGRSIFATYDGGDLTFSVSAARVQLEPLIVATVTVVPTSLLCVVGYHLHWSRILLLQSREREMRELAVSAQLAALRAQINPHFFFNSLNSIAQLISTDPEKAEDCVERLADIFRYMLKRSEDEFVSLADELEIADSYLEIERARFGDSLRVTRSIDPAATGVVVPGLVLQPLVENAVKHGISRKIGGGEVRIDARLEGGDLVLTVRDTGAGMAADRAPFDSGVGLRNVRDRLVKHYGEAYAPKLTSGEGVGTTVTVRVPVAALQLQRKAA